MSENSKIEWTDTTWNPLRGCTLAIYLYAGAGRYAEGVPAQMAAQCVRVAIRKHEGPTHHQLLRVPRHTTPIASGWGFHAGPSMPSDMAWHRLMQQVRRAYAQLGHADLRSWHVRARRPAKTNE